jgi:hypothetical protein
LRVVSSALFLPSPRSPAFEFASFKQDAEGLLSNEEGGWRFTEIKLRPVVTAPKEEDRERVIRLSRKPKSRASSQGRFNAKSSSFPAVKIEEALSVPV